MYTITAEKSLPESEHEIMLEISYETLAKHRATALREISRNFQMPGFRAGHVPENVIVSKVGELSILEEAAHEAIEEILPKGKLLMHLSKEEMQTSLKRL